ncbi:hypothetical protein ACFODZ_07425 [Marinicella sediminis]|uniref:Uncharacterized protein n=1 Tax=Marinicella sediminis TaxID=1792834 RepID=A0ABV7JF88_9GAMM|nr:hypothetical protein [Marinicella sediminis]
MGQLNAFRRRIEALEDAVFDDNLGHSGNLGALIYNAVDQAFSAQNTRSRAMIRYRPDTDSRPTAAMIRYRPDVDTRRPGGAMIRYRPDVDYRRPDGAMIRYRPDVDTRRPDAAMIRYRPDVDTRRPDAAMIRYRPDVDTRRPDAAMIRYRPDVDTRRPDRAMIRYRPDNDNRLNALDPADGVDGGVNLLQPMLIQLASVLGPEKAMKALEQAQKAAGLEENNDSDTKSANPKAKKK